MDSIEVKIARLEEGMVSVKGDTRHIREKLDEVVQNHFHLSGKIIGTATTMSFLVTILTTVVVKFILK